MPPLVFLLLIPFAVLAWARPWAGIFAILVLLPAYVLRWDIWLMPTTFIELAIYITSALWLLKFGWRPVYEFLKSADPKWTAAAIGWLIAALIGTIVASDKRIALGILKGWIIDPMIFVLLTSLIAAQSKSLRIFWKNAILAMLVGAAGVGLFATMHAILYGGRPAVFFDSPNVMSMYLVPVLVAGLAWYFKEKITLVSAAQRSIWLTLCLFVFLGILASNSVSGLLALVSSGMIFLILKQKDLPAVRRSVAILLLAVGILSPWVIVVRNSFPLPTRSNPTSGATSGEIRVILWREATNSVLQKPLWGIGLGQWQREFASRLKPGLAGALNPGYLIELHYASLFPHNLWLTTWLFMGILGLAALITIIWLVYESAEFYALPSAVLSAILIVGIVDTPVYKNDLSILLWLIFASAAGARALANHDRTRQGI